jgi:hypothetical protein
LDHIYDGENLDNFQCSILLSSVLIPTGRSWSIHPATRDTPKNKLLLPIRDQIQAFARFCYNDGWKSPNLSAITAPLISAGAGDERKEKICDKKLRYWFHLYLPWPYY